MDLENVDIKYFSKRISKASKNVLKPLIPALGLHTKTEKVLTMRYIDENSLWECANKLGIAYETFANYLCVARAEMLDTIKNDYDILPEKVQILIRKLV